MRDRFYNCDAEEIREVENLLQRGIAPDDVVVAYESVEQDTMNYFDQ